MEQDNNIDIKDDGDLVMVEHPTSLLSTTSNNSDRKKKNTKDSGGPQSSSSSSSNNNNNEDDANTAELKKFCVSQASCLKCSPLEFYDWLVAQDIESLNDLADACIDEDYTKTEMRNSGLKAYKRGPFINAVKIAASGMK